MLHLLTRRLVSSDLSIDQVLKRIKTFGENLGKRQGIRSPDGHFVVYM
ncbi:hypothetical protein [Planctomicrobium sp. SH527]